MFFAYYGLSQWCSASIPVRNRDDYTPFSKNNTAGEIAAGPAAFIAEIGKTFRQVIAGNRFLGV
jgi:hypothetical protein